MHESFFVVRVRYRRKESSHSLSHLLMSFFLKYTKEGKGRREGKREGGTSILYTLYNRSAADVSPLAGDYVTGNLWYRLTRNTAIMLCYYAFAGLAAQSPMRLCKAVIFTSCSNAALRGRRMLSLKKVLISTSAPVQSALRAAAVWC